MQTISLQTNLLYSTNVNDIGIKQQTVESHQSHVQSAVEKVEQNINNNLYGFISTLKNNDMEIQTQQACNQLSWAKYFVIIGIGGSDLGGRALQQALEDDNNPVQVIFHGDSTDPVAIRKLLKKIDLNTTVFNIVSKSGETIETISQYIFLKQHLIDNNLTWTKHFIFTTDQKKGVLREEADKYNILTVPIPDDVGGRFSVLTPVGTLPAHLLGINTVELRQGALDFANDPTCRLIAQQIATTQYYLYQQGIKVAVLTPYSVELEEWARWYRQLWAESLGKDNQGILPIQARGPADQHSQYQFYNQGSPIASYWHLQIDNRTTDYTIGRTDVKAGEYLIGHTFHEILNIEQHASALALKKSGRPVATIHLNQLTPYSFGQLFICFELAVVYLAEMLQVNAFDQPGVEEGKQFMYALLNKPGYQDKRKEIEQITG